VSDYVQEDSQFLVNQYDDILRPQRILLPSLTDFYSEQLGHPVSWDEAIKYVDGYGLKPEEQVFRYQTMPDKIANIIPVIKRKYGVSKGKTVSVETVYQELRDNKKYYADEIEWIKREIKRRYVGYWTFINGKPTYIDPWHYFYLNYWSITNNRKGSNGRPDYRDNDRRRFHFVRYCYTTHEAWYQYAVYYREQGSPKIRYFSKLYGEDGVNDFCKKLSDAGIDFTVRGEDSKEGFYVEMPTRTVAGMINPKRRRKGSTSMDCAIGYCIVTEARQRNGGIQSLNDEKATTVYLDQVIKPWQKLPFFFKPAHDGSSNPKERLNFQFPADRTNLGVTDRQVLAHEGWIEPRASGERAFDGTMLHFCMRDEGGKIENSVYDLNEWWSIHRKCISQGFRYHGLSLISSTFGEMDSGGGRQFQSLIKDSYFEDRDRNGQTRSGLLVYMEPAFDGLDGFFDKFGMPIIDDPKKPVETTDGTFTSVGAKTALENKRSALSAAGDEERLISEMRDFPNTLREGMTTGRSTSGFNVAILRNRISYLRFTRRSSLTRTVSLEWKADFGGDVRVVDDPTGMFHVSFIPEPELRNKKVYDPTIDGWMPDPSVCGKFILGIDPYGFREEDIVSDGSKGAGAMFYRRDYLIDDEDKPIEQWSSNKFVLDYVNRPPEPEQFAEEMLKACILYGAFAFPEMNWPLIADKFRDWGYHGYLLHLIDHFGAPLSMPGIKTTGASKTDILSRVQEYIQRYGQYENHLNILEDWYALNGPDDMTNRDLTAASGVALVGAYSKYPQSFDDQRPKDYDSPFGTFEY